MNLAPLVALGAVALLLGRKRPARPARPVLPTGGPVRPVGPVRPPGAAVDDLTSTPPIVDIVPPDPSSEVVTDPEIIWDAKGVLWRWFNSDGYASGTAPALSPAYGAAPPDNEHAWSDRDGAVLAAFLAWNGLTATTAPTRAALSALTAWSLGHPDDATPPGDSPPAAPAAAYFVVRNGDGGMYQIADRFFGGTDVWRDLANAQPDASRRAQILAGKMSAGWRLKVPADLVSRYTASTTRPLETYAEAVAVDGKVSES